MAGACRSRTHLTIGEAIACALAGTPLSTTTDVEFVQQQDGTFLAFPLTERGGAVLPIYNGGSPVFASHKAAWDIALKLRGAAWQCKVKIDPLPTPDAELERFRLLMEERSGDDQMFIARGRVYVIGAEPKDVERHKWLASTGRAEPLGHSGRRFVVCFADRVVVTSNLWDRGPIPHELLADWPDTAEFVGGRP